jgi:N-acetylmuramoyl-L-alanine amidase
METPGKRTPPIPELGGRVIRENEFNRAVVKYLDIELRRCGINTLLVAPTDTDTSLEERTNLANSNNADIYVSIHYNAYDETFGDYDPEGLQIHIYPNTSRRLAECVLKYLKEGTPQKNRGIKEDNFHVLRETSMPAILTENGFMDNKREAMLMIDTNFQKEVACEHAKGICEYFGVPYISEPTTLYRVQVGAYSIKENAINMQNRLQTHGYSSILVWNDTLKVYRVQVGAFSIRENAENLKAELIGKGFEAIIVES